MEKKRKQRAEERGGGKNNEHQPPLFPSPALRRDPPRNPANLALIARRSGRKVQGEFFVCTGGSARDKGPSRPPTEGMVRLVAFPFFPTVCLVLLFSVAFSFSTFFLFFVVFLYASLSNKMFLQREPARCTLLRIASPPDGQRPKVVVGTRPDGKPSEFSSMTSFRRT